MREPRARRAGELVLLGIADAPDIDELHTVCDRLREAGKMMARRPVVVGCSPRFERSTELALDLRLRLVASRQGCIPCRQIQVAVDDDESRGTELGVGCDKLCIPE